jgi:hypothetical protein
MPKEYLNYTLTTRNGAKWALIDGTYPIYCSAAEEPVVMGYPMPPETTNITVELNGTRLAWSNFTEQYPDALHHTILGDWALIQFAFSPADLCVLSLHYEHPIVAVNGTCMFLYDINLNSYLSAQCPSSTAYFTLKTPNTLPNLQIYAVPADTQKNPINYTTQTHNGAQEVTFQITSQNTQPLPGDILFTYTDAESPTQEPTPTNGNAAFQWNLVWAIVFIACGLTFLGFVLVRKLVFKSPI